MNASSLAPVGSAIKPNPSSGRSIIMLSNQAVEIHIREWETGRMVQRIVVNQGNRGQEFPLELSRKGTFSVQQLNELGQVISHELWLLP